MSAMFAEMEGSSTGLVERDVISNYLIVMIENKNKMITSNDYLIRLGHLKRFIDSKVENASVEMKKCYGLENN